MSRNAACWLVVLLALACVQAAAARSSDRNKPMLIDAGQTTGTLDDRTPTVLSQGVTIDQGTLHVEAARAVLSTRDGDIARAVLSGSPAQLRQELDDGTPMSAAANEIDYDMRTEVVVLTGDVLIKQPRNSLRGERVVYNMRTGQVSSGGEGAGRVRMRILPKNAGDAGASGDADSGAPADGPVESDTGDDEGEATEVPVPAGDDVTSADSAAEGG